MPNCSSSSSQPPNAPGTQAASTPVPGDELVAELVVALDRGSAGRDPLTAERDRLPAVDWEEERGHLAARAVQVRLDDLQRQAGRDRCVERVATALEHGHAGRGREPVRRRDHPERAAQLGPGREAHWKIRHVVVPCASSLPFESVSFPSAVAIARALVDDDPLAADHARVGRDRADEVRLHLERRVADALLEQRVHGAAHRRVEQRQRDTAVHRADRVVVLRAGLHLEDGAPGLGQDEAKAHQLGDRRRRQLARDDRLDVLHPGELAPSLGDVTRIDRIDAGHVA